MDSPAAKYIKEISASLDAGRMITPTKWLEYAYNLTTCLYPEGKLYWEKFQKVAAMRKALLAAQQKKNVSAVDAEVEASDEYKDLQLQGIVLEQIREYERIAKQHSNILA